MQLDRTNPMLGRRWAEWKAFFARPPYSTPDLMGFVSLTEPDIEEVISVLIRGDWVEYDRRYDGIDYWMPGNAAMRLLATTLYPRINRKRADQELEKILNAVRSVNSDDRFVHTVVAVELFGSMIGDTDEIGDIDVALEIAERDLAEDIAQARIRVLEASAPNGLFWGMRSIWPKLALAKVIKQSTRYASLHDTNELDELKCAHVRVFELDPELAREIRPTTKLRSQKYGSTSALERPEAENPHGYPRRERRKPPSRPNGAHTMRCSVSELREIQHRWQNGEKTAAIRKRILARGSRATVNAIEAYLASLSTAGKASHGICASLTNTICANLQSGTPYKAYAKLTMMSGALVEGVLTLMPVTETQHRATAMFFKDEGELKGSADMLAQTEQVIGAIQRWAEALAPAARGLRIEVATLFETSSIQDTAEAGRPSLRGVAKHARKSNEPLTVKIVPNRIISFVEPIRWPKDRLDKVRRDLEELIDNGVGTVAPLETWNLVLLPKPSTPTEEDDEEQGSSSNKINHSPIG